MRGSVYKRCPCGVSGTPNKAACRKQHGTWSWRADGGPDRVTGKRKQQSGSGFPTQEKAQKALNEFLSAQGAGAGTDDENMTVEQWLTIWLEVCRQRVLNGSMTKKTFANYESAVRTVLIPHLGRRRLRDLRHKHVETMVADAIIPDRPAAPKDADRPRKRCGEPKKSDGTPCERWATDKCPWHGGSDPTPRRGRIGRVVDTRSATSLTSYIRILRAALSAAVSEDLISRNPAQGRIKTMPAKTKRRAEFWQADDVARFLLGVQADRLAALYELAAFAGLRRAELLGLQWSDVDLTSATPGITVRQTLVAVAGRHDCIGCGSQHTGHYLKPPKSDAGDRWVPLVGGAVRELLAHQAAQSSERDKWGPAYVDHQLVLCREDGNPVPPDSATKRFNELAAEHGLPAIHLHDMRHGACALLLAAGMPIEIVSMILGHANTSTTRELYAYVLKAPASEWMRKAEALVRGEAA